MSRVGTRRPLGIGSAADAVEMRNYFRPQIATFVGFVLLQEFAVVSYGSSLRRGLRTDWRTAMPEGENAKESSSILTSTVGRRR